MTEPETGAPAPPPADPEAGRRRAVALAGARVARHGGPFADGRARLALDLAGGYSEGKVPIAELRSGLRELEAAAEEARGRMAGRADTIFEARRAGAAAEEYRAARAVADALGRAVGPAGCAAPAPAALDPRWLTADVVALARVASAGRADLLPILADALQDAGCTDAGLLGHCRGPGPHAPDCWAVGLILGPAPAGHPCPAPTHR